MNFEKWSEETVGSLIKSVSNTYKFDKKDKIVLINTSDVFEGFVTNNSYQKYDTIPGQFKKTFEKGDILFSEIRPKNKRFAYIDFDSKNYIASTKLMVLRSKNKNRLDPLYLYYYLTSNEILTVLQNIAESRSGTFPQITFTEVSQLKINLPSVLEQKNIVNFIKMLDKRIELNNKINNNLEELAQTLYKHWFVDFEFPNEEGLPYKSSGGKMVDSELGLIPEGWSVIKLNDIIDYSNGYAFKSKDYEETGKYKVITIRNVKDGKFDLSNVSKVHKIPERIREDQILIIGDILISLTGNVGRVAIVDEDNCLLNQRVAKISSLDSNYKGFIYFILRNNEIFNKIVSLGKGSAQQNLSPIEMLKIKMTLPKSVDNIVLNKFNTMFNILIHNEIENKKLTKLRDLLLPKLMSGEIRVPMKEE